MVRIKNHHVGSDVYLGLEERSRKTGAIIWETMESGTRAPTVGLENIGWL